jgi:hypothetical protein
MLPALSWVRPVKPKFRVAAAVGAVVMLRGKKGAHASTTGAR